MKARHLVPALQAAGRVVPNGSSIPILQTVRLEPKGDSTTRLTATDLDIGLELEIVGNGIEPVCPPFKKLLAACRTAGAGSVTTEDKIIRVGGVSLLCQDVDDYPKAAEVTTAPMLRLYPKGIKTLCEAACAASTDPNRPMLNGVLLTAELAGGNMPDHGRPYAIATDGHRLYKAPVGGPLPVVDTGEESRLDWPDQEIIVPPKALRVLDFLEAEAVDVRLAEHYITFSGLGKTAGRFTLTARLLEGPYPDYAQVIPTEPRNVGKVDGRRLAQAITAAAVTSDAATNQGKMSIEANRVKIETQTADVGTGTAEIPCSYEGPALEIGYNLRYTLEALTFLCGFNPLNKTPKGAGEPLVTFDIGGPVGASVWTKGRRLALVMPVKLPEEIQEAENEPEGATTEPDAAECTTEPDDEPTEKESE